MSVHQIENAVFYQVVGNPTICRYIDVRKFISMLLKKSLFFVRISKLDDPYEGTYPKITRQKRIEWYQDHLRKNPEVRRLSDDEIQQNVLDSEQMDLLIREITCINSWHNFEKENFLLWKSYSNIDAGVAILSTYNKLHDQLNLVKEKDFTISRVEYGNYESGYFGHGNSNLAFIHKPDFYSDEKEIRAIIELQHEAGWIHDWENEENENGIYVPVNLDILIDEIIVAPFAPKWYFEIIQSLNKKYDLNKPVRYSALRK